MQGLHAFFPEHMHSASAPELYTLLLVIVIILLLTLQNTIHSRCPYSPACTSEVSLTSFHRSLLCASRNIATAFWKCSKLSKQPLTFAPQLYLDFCVPNVPCSFCIQKILQRYYPKASQTLCTLNMSLTYKRNSRSDAYFMHSKRVPT